VKRYLKKRLLQQRSRENMEKNYDLSELLRDEVPDEKQIAEK
jgi:hypothetical protein